MIFLVFNSERALLREDRGRWMQVSVPKEFVNTDIVCGFYREDFLEWRKQKVTFFELGRFFNPYEVNEEDVKEFVELCIEHGILDPYSGRINTIGYARKKVLEALSPILSTEETPQENAGFYGGRTEFYRQKAEGHIVYYDINSAYGWAMSQPLPDRNRERVYRGLSYEDILELSEKFFILFSGEVYQDRDLPVCPVKLKIREEEVFYPRGKLSGVWTNYELSLLQPEEVLKIDTVWAYPYSSFSLREVVEDFYSQREKGLAHKVFYKWQIVLLYGMVGWKQKGFLKSRLIGAYITARTRKELYEKLLMAQEYGNLLYCDTDSFFLLASPENHKKLQELLPVRPGLGGWGIRKEVNSLEVYGFKRYVCRMDNEYFVAMSGERIDHIDEHGRFYRRNFYTGQILRVEISEQELSKRKLTEEGHTVPWSIEELHALAKQETQKTAKKARVKLR